ncbi:disease resistance protein RPM1 [Prunus yedoensis var. nudiflora]|uniref:Disease resistance protein RPM1 n=1 Tax=Prunus yedoensis var. nudiflora TaxID=2094558 RepID=A0A314XJL3_PRUYE|nr:disease resistance protein RPM1 [Prunus yedoensis var. nudiflora]
MPHLISLEVKAINGDEIIDLQHISSPPQCLQVLSLIGRLEKLPDWIAGLCLLTQLSLGWSGLASDHDPLKVLQVLPNLMDLKIHEAFSCEELHFERGFPKLKRLKLGPLKGLKLMTIHNGALPLLETLGFGPSPQLQQVPSGIRHLKNLKSLVLVDMPSRLMDGIHVQEAKHRLGPRVLFRNTKGNNRYRTIKVIDSAIFV